MRNGSPALHITRVSLAKSKYQGSFSRMVRACLVLVRVFRKIEVFSVSYPYPIRRMYELFQSKNVPTKTESY